MSNPSRDPVMSTAEEAAWRQRYGEDEAEVARKEHRLLINDVPYSLLYGYCKRFGLEIDHKIYLTVTNHLKARGLL